MKRYTMFGSKGFELFLIQWYLFFVAAVEPNNLIVGIVDSSSIIAQVVQPRTTNADNIASNSSEAIGRKAVVQ